MHVLLLSCRSETAQLEMLKLELDLDAKYQHALKTLCSTARAYGIRKFSRFVRWAEQLAMFYFVPKYRKGTQILIPDTLSRLPLPFMRERRAFPWRTLTWQSLKMNCCLLSGGTWRRAGQTRQRSLRRCCRTSWSVTSWKLMVVSIEATAYLCQGLFICKS